MDCHAWETMQTYHHHISLLAKTSSNIIASEQPFLDGLVLSFVFAGPPGLLFNAAMSSPLPVCVLFCCYSPSCPLAANK